MLGAKVDCTHVHRRYIKKANDRRDGVNVAVFEGGTNKLMESLHTSDRSVIGV